MGISTHIEAIQKRRVWDDRPVYCYTSDLDWCSEAALEIFLEAVDTYRVNPTLFVTHQSDILQQYADLGKVLLGIHPNFLKGSSHGDTFTDVIDYCLSLVPGAKVSRSHRAFLTTETAHLLYDAGICYASDIVTMMQPNIRPLLHESGLVQLPVFWEDGTYLYHDSPPAPFAWMVSPGLKIISMHPMHYVINTPYFKYMRGVKDSCGVAYRSLDKDTLDELSWPGQGVRGVHKKMFELSHRGAVMSLDEIYQEAVS